MPRRKKSGRVSKSKEKEKEKELEEEFKDEDKKEENECEAEEKNEVQEEKPVSSPENKEELNPPKPKKPALERRTITSPVKVCYPLEKLFEYQWPPDIHGEFYYLEYQVSDFVADIALPQKHPDIERHILTAEEKHFLKEKSILTETQTASDLLAIKCEDVCQLILDCYPNKYKEFNQLSHERERRRLIRKAEEERQALTKRKVPNYMKRALKDIAEFNSQLAMQRKEERSSYFDMQTQIILIPANKTCRLHRDVTTPSQYPVALLPGQFQEYYRHGLATRKMTSNVSSTPTEKQPFGIAARLLFSNSNTDDESGPDESFFRSASRVSNISTSDSASGSAETEMPVIGDRFITILPAPEACQTLPGAVSVPMKPYQLMAKMNPSKYNPPPFIATVTYMRDKFYEVAGLNSTQEPPEAPRFVSLWKEELRKESWFTDENPIEVKESDEMETSQKSKVREGQWVAAFFTVGLYFGRVEAIFPDGSLECRFANLVTQNKYKIRTEREVVLPKDVISSNVQASYMANNIFQLDCDWRLIRDEQERRKKLFNASKRVNKLWTFNKKTAADLLKTVVKVEGITLTARDFKFIDDNWSPTDMELMCTATPGKEREKGMVKRGYLNDQVVDAKIKQIQTEANDMGKAVICGSTFLLKQLEKGYGCYRKVNFNSFDLVLLPVNDGEHWSLAIIDIKKRSFGYCNSIPGYGCDKSIVEHLRSLLKDSQIDASKWAWKLLQTPEQPDNMSCGVYMLKMAECVCGLDTLSFAQMKPA